jgi:hypothetical protein
LGTPSFPPPDLAAADQRAFPELRTKCSMWFDEDVFNRTPGAILESFLLLQQHASSRA